MSTPKVTDSIKVRRDAGGMVCLLAMRADGSITLKPEHRQRTTVVEHRTDPWNRNREHLIRWAVLNGYHRVVERQPDARPAWEVEAHQKIVDFLLREGSPVGEMDTMYGWMARDYAELDEHVKSCGLVYPECKWDDADWTEWGGTFHDDIPRRGLEVKVYCQCGEVAGRTWRYTGTHGDLLRAITEVK